MSLDIQRLLQVTETDIQQAWVNNIPANSMTYFLDKRIEQAMTEVAQGVAAKALWGVYDLMEEELELRQLDFGEALTAAGIQRPEM